MASMHAMLYAQVLINTNDFFAEKSLDNNVP